MEKKISNFTKFQVFSFYKDHQIFLTIKRYNLFNLNTHYALIYLLIVFYNKYNYFVSFNVMLIVQ